MTERIGEMSEKIRRRYNEKAAPRRKETRIKYKGRPRRRDKAIPGSAAGESEWDRPSRLAAAGLE